MKPNAFIRFAGAALLLGSVLCACNDMPDPLESQVPEVGFDNSLTNLTAVVDEPFAFQAQVAGEGRTASRWYVNGILEGSASGFVYTFPAPGIYSVKYVASNNAGEFTKTFSVTVADKLKVELSIGAETEIIRHQFSELQVGAVVLQGVNVTHQWEIDGVIVSTQAVLEGFMLNEARVYQVVYTGTNAVGEVIIPFSVRVIEAPLTISFTPNASRLTVYTGNDATFAANVTAGGAGIAHSWKVNDTEESTDATFVYPCTAPGTYIVAYYGINTKGEEITKSWTLTVEDPPYVICDFESLQDITAGSLLPGNGGDVLVSGNQPGFIVMDNLAPDDVNSSSKIVKIYVHGTTGTSGVFEIYLGRIIPAMTNVGQYSKIRFKIYRPSDNLYFPRIQVNQGGRLTPVSSPAAYDAWETLTFEFTPNTGLSQITIRPLLDSEGANISTLGTRIIYIDDIELLN